MELKRKKKKERKRLRILNENKGKKSFILCFVLLLLHGRQVKLLASDATVHVNHIINSSLKVASSIIALADEDLGLSAIIIGLLDITDRDELLIDSTKKVKSRLQFLDRIAFLLNGGRASSNPTALGSNVVGEAHDGHVDIRLTTDLLLRDDDLSALSIVGIGDRVAEDADGTNDLASGVDTVREVRRISNDELALGDGLGVLRRLDTDSLAVLHDDVVDRSIQHVGTTIDGAETSKALRKLTKTVERVQVGALGIGITRQGVEVELHTNDGLESGLLQVVIVQVQADSVTDEIDGVGLEVKLGVELSHGHLVEVVALVSLGILRLVVLSIDKELGATTLLKETHEAALKSLSLIRRHLVDLASAEHIGTTDGLELKVAGNVGVEESLHQLAHAHDKLGDNINVVVTGSAKIGAGSGALLVSLKELIELKRGRSTTVVAVAIKVKHLHAVHRKKTAENALLQASAHNNDIIGILHLCRELFPR